MKAAYSTPMYHVAELERSIPFYESLGFTLRDSEGCGPLSWARMECEGGAIMFLRAEEPLELKQQGSMLVMYTPDLAALRNDLVAKGIDCAPIKHPPYMPSGEMFVKDPDGYPIFIHHWGEKEHTAWLAHLEEWKKK